jgi:hypothetical protein
MQLTVERLKPTAKSLVLTCGGVEYFAKKDSGISAGMTIEAEVEPSEFNGKTYRWVKKYTKVSDGNAAPQSSSPSSSGSGAAGAAPAWLPFASNTVAHAISAGIITAPNQVEAWVQAAHDAYNHVNKHI